MKFNNIFLLNLQIILLFIGIQLYAQEVEPLVCKELKSTVYHATQIGNTNEFQKLPIELRDPAQILYNLYMQDPNKSLLQFLNYRQQDFFKQCNQEDIVKILKAGADKDISIIYDVMAEKNYNLNQAFLAEIGLLLATKKILGYNPSPNNPRSNLVFEDVIKAFIAAGVNINQKQKFQNKLLLPLVTILVKMSFIPESFSLMAFDIALYDILEQPNLDINAADEAGDTPLMYATQGVHRAIWGTSYRTLDTLLVHGADVNKTNNKGENVLLFFIKHIPQTMSINDADNIIDILLNAKVNVNQQDIEGSTALIEVSQKGDTIIVDKLINAGANVNLVDNDGNTALLYAVQEAQDDFDDEDRGNYEADKNIIESLIKAGADLFYQDLDGNSALDYATSEELRNYLMSFKGG